MTIKEIMDAYKKCFNEDPPYYFIMELEKIVIKSIDNQDQSVL
jgi:hypothetical protein